MEPVPVILGLILWCSAVLAGSACLVWAIASRRRPATTAAACLWCVVAGFALSSALWSWMATASLDAQYRRLARSPEGALAKDARLDLIGMQVFFIHLDRLGRKLSYLPVLIPLAGSLALMRRGRGDDLDPKGVRGGGDVLD